MKPLDKLKGLKGLIAWADLPKEPMPETKFELCDSCQGVGIRSFGRVFICGSCDGLGWKVVLPKFGTMLTTEHEALAFCRITGNITIEYAKRHITDDSLRVSLTYRSEQTDLILRGPSLLWVVNKLITVMVKADKHLFTQYYVDLED